MSINPFRNPRVQIILAIGVITVVGFYYWTVNRYQPRLEVIEQLANREARLLQINQQTRRAIAALGLDRIHAILEAYDRQAEYVGQLVPPDGQDLRILPAISRHAEAFGVRLEEITPVDPIREGSFMVYRFRINAMGGYHDIGAFLAELLSLPRITQIRDAKLRAVTIGFQDGQPIRGVRASFDLLAYARVVADSSGTSTAGTGGGR